jgi:hypothetical protein
MSAPLIQPFTPTVADYSAATQFLGRLCLGRKRWIYFIGLGIAGGLLIKGFILMVDAVFLAAQHGDATGQFGSALTIAGGYLFMGLVLWVRRYLRRKTYIPGGYFLAERRTELSEVGLISTGGYTRFEAQWNQVIGWHEDKQRFYLQLEPAFALFIPKSAVPDHAALRAFFSSHIRAKP